MRPRHFAKTPRFRRAQVHGKITGAAPVIARYQTLTGKRAQIEIAKAGADDVWRRTGTVDARRRKRRPLGKDVVAVYILSGGDIERLAGAGIDEWIQRNTPPRQIECAERTQAMAKVIGRSAILA